jgi:hypothetical protein
MDIAEWLRALGLDQYEQAFHDNAINAEVLPDITDADLVALGIRVLGHRKKLLKVISASEYSASVTGSAVPPYAERQNQNSSGAELQSYSQISPARRSSPPELTLRTFAKFCAPTTIAVLLWCSILTGRSLNIRAMELSHTSDTLVGDQAILERRAAVRAIRFQKADGAALVAEHDEVLAKDAQAAGQVLLLVAKDDRLPEASQVFAAGRVRPDASQFLVFRR